MMLKKLENISGPNTGHLAPEASTQPTVLIHTPFRAYAGSKDP